MLKKVVIIDDNQTQLRILKSRFINDEWDVICASSVAEAMEKICTNAPDLIITDAIMPKTGGFELLKKLREDENLVKIPVIVYSILTQNLANLYIKEKLGEYFLSKSDNPENILNLAKKATEENPLSSEDKALIAQNYNNINNVKNPIINEQIKTIINETEIQKNFTFKIEENTLLQSIKEKYSSLMNDEKISQELFKITYPLLSYDLAALCFYDYANQEKKIYFDIKNFIFNPILESYFTVLFECKNTKSYKTYAPNSKVITSVKEFNSKIELDFEYKKQSIANFYFYSKKENIWSNEKSKDILKHILKDFFADRYISKNYQNNTKKDSYDNYLRNSINVNLKNNFNPAKTKIGMYLGVLDISNYKDIEVNSWEEDLDVLNSKISKTIVSCISKDEQVEKINDREYNIIILSDDSTKAKKKFSIILNSLDIISINDIKPEVVIGISNCYTNNIFNIEEAQRKAHIALENTSKENKMVAYAE